MAIVVNKADPSIFHISVNEPDYPQVDWLWDPPGFDALYPSVASKYWALNGAGTDIVEMTSREKANIDVEAAKRDLPLLGSAPRVIATGVDVAHGMWKLQIRDRGLQSAAGNYGPIARGNTETIVDQNRTKVIIALSQVGVLTVRRLGSARTHLKIQEYGSR